MVPVLVIQGTIPKTETTFRCRHKVIEGIFRLRNDENDHAYPRRKGNMELHEALFLNFDFIFGGLSVLY